MGRRFVAIVGVLLLAMSAVAPLPAQPAAERRIALVIANSNYRNATRLQNTLADGRAMESALRQRGFEVVAGYDLDRYGMLRTIEEFLNRLSSGSVAVVYFSGHGVQLDGQNLLLPVDISAESRSVLAYDGYPLGRLIEQMTATRARFSLAIVDACRDNPFPIATRSLGVTRGLAAPTTAAGAMVVYSAGANQQAIDNLGVTDPNPNGLFTREFLKVIAEPGLSIHQAITKVRLAVASAAESIGQKQTPAIYDESTGDFIFTPGSVKVEVAVVVTPPVAVPRPALPAAPELAVPSGGGMSLDDLASMDAAAKAKWDGWQRQMQADFDKVAAFSGVPETRRAAWDRFLATYGQENPHSDDDGALRHEAHSRKAAIEDSPRLAMARPPQPAQLAAAARAPGGVFRDCPECPEMVAVPGGNFTMGSPASETERDTDEGPQHSVAIPAFAMGRYPVTQGEWRAIMGNSPGKFAGDRNPVEQVSWDDAREYVRRLNAKVRPAAGGDGPYRLPSEAEWEYAARGGTTTARWWGDDGGHDQQCAYANGADLTAKDSKPSWTTANCRDGYVNTSPAGSFRPNPFGLYDMLGNVWQWTGDCWRANYDGAPSDGTASMAGDCVKRAARGGSWISKPRFLRSTQRGAIDVGVRGDFVGFRLARTLP